MTNSSNTTINVEATLFSKLFYKGKFTVPWHQRYYDWKENDVEALLKDIDDAIKEKRNYYFLGTIMLVETKPGHWEINDGQQRMVTISIICAALCRRFHDERLGSQREGFALRILFDIEADSEAVLNQSADYIPRITPPKDDAAVYHQIIRGHSIASNGRLTTAWNAINRFFFTMNLQQIKKYFDFLRKNLEIVILYVPKTVDSNAIYETINCRGKKLDDFDLIRNYLYSFFRSDTEAQRKRIMHVQLESVRTYFKKIEKSSEYMRCRLQCEFGFLHKDSFYNDFKKNIPPVKNRLSKPQKNYISELTERITSIEDRNLFDFITVSSPDPDCIKKFTNDSLTQKSRRGLDVLLHELREYKISQPLVFSMLTLYTNEKNEKKRVARIVHRNLNRLATFILRTAFVSKFAPSKFEEEFSNYAKKITLSHKIIDDQFINFLRNCDQRSEYRVLNDSEFRRAIEETRMIGKRKIRQFLLGVNSYLQKDMSLIKRDACTIEHILPQSNQHRAGWVGFEDTNPEDWVDKIGNLTLLAPNDNKPGIKYNSNFKKKRSAFQDSSLRITRDIMLQSKWTPKEIKERQEMMAEYAVRVWKFE